MEVLLGAWREALRADRAGVELVRIRAELQHDFYDHITAVLRGIESTSRLLRDLYDLFPIYRSRVPMIVYYLDITLPSIEKTIKLMMAYIDNEAFPARTQWTLMVERLGDQGGMSLPTRFVMYVDLLVQLVRLLSRSPLYDPTTLELLRLRNLRLRQLQGLPAPPASTVPHHAPMQPTEADLERRHWAEKIFDDQPHSATSLRHRRESMCFGPPMVDEMLGIIPGSTVLFKLFSQQCLNDHVVVAEFESFKSNLVAEMVLFHCAFAALKSRCPLTVNVTPEDVCLQGEKKLFQGKIIDDGFEHVLTVLQDFKCGGIRLHAAVRSGELRKCPVWTAFITYQSESSKWLNRRSRHRICLRDIHPYVFCQKYKKRHQMKKTGEFELYFVVEDAADAFQDIFTEDSNSAGEG
ncbi:uncharacterized protein RCO7_08575 [Rhynchosporium graminicola]|uniref:PH domain-containing protein n=1 Tax=Rhynchosporium graminicola TaxID=2792576 RepID=A0A1E1JXA7_9HELO|nr:uncharacterized protein RCO7_08575 [Rhynchosporium commune]